MSTLLKFPIEDQSHIGEIRRSVQSWAQDLGYSETVVGKISIVINELGTNVVKHAQRGEMIVQVFNSQILILALDRGPGMENLHSCMNDGFSTAGTAGNGLGAIKRLTDLFDVFTALGKGSIVLCGFRKDPFGALETSPWEFFGFSLPMKGEQVSGDGWKCSRSATGRRKIVVSDGLGHGLLAHEATQRAINSFCDSDSESPLLDIKNIHNALRSSRGAAVSEALIDHEKKTILYCGLGNVQGTVISPSSTKRLISYNGTAGVQLLKIQELTYPLESDSLVVFTSDGIGTQWTLKDYPGIFNRHPLIVAGALYRDFNRNTDDVTVVVARETL
jgi:anti-sigma regulatory factor (Ser/Thr protein kinase)